MRVDQTRDDSVDTDGFPGSRDAGDQEVRHLGQIRDHGIALEVLAERDREGARRAMIFGALDQFAHVNHARRGVRDLDAHGGLPRDRRHNAERGGPHRECQIIGEGRDAAHLHARAGRDFVLGHHGAHRTAGNRAFHPERL